MDYVECGNMKPMYNYKVAAIKQQQDEHREVYLDFKEGVNDPSNLAAKIERDWYQKMNTKMKKDK